MTFNRIKYFLAALTAALMWGFFAIPLRNLKDYPAEDILCYRIFTSLLITWLIMFLRRQKLTADITYFKNETQPNRRKFIILTLTAGILITGNWFTFIYAVNNVSLKSAAFAYMVCPLITAMGGFIILKEHLSVIKLSAIGIAVISILILAQGSLTDVLWSVFIASLYAFYLIIQRVLVQVDKLNILGIQLLISAMLILPIFAAHFHSIPTSLVFWINIVLISVFFTIIPLFLSLYALIGMPSSTMGIIIYVNPIVAFGVAFSYFHETITTQQLLAYSLLLAAVILFNWNIISGMVQKKAITQTETPVN